MPVPAPAGNPPDLQRRAGAPIELPRVVMRGALAVALGGLLLALLLGLWRARADMRDELDGALLQARTMAVVAQIGQRPRSEVLAALRALQDEAGAPRHLRLRVLDAAGRALLPEVAEPAPGALLRALMALNQRVFAPPAPRAVGWNMAWPDGEVWRLRVLASSDAEQVEALEHLLELLGLLALGSALMLAVMRRNVRRSFRPLRPLLDAIARLERQELAPLRDLPVMPIRELDAIATALRQLAAALEQAETARRLLGQRVQTLQEDERSRLARELHDEFGQRLTALRVDAAWLQRRLASQPELAQVVAGMSEQCAQIQQELRALLARLRPALGDGGGGERASVAQLQSLLAALVEGWARSPQQHTRYTLQVALDGVEPTLALPRDLVLAVYRISQEALTNVARHARARSARLALHVAPGRLRWSVEDDGCGLDAAAWQRGSGLAGLKERVWAAGGDLDWRALDAAAPHAPGLRLAAELPFEAGAQ